jgi:hypothetical protein
MINIGQAKSLSCNVAKYNLTSINITFHWHTTFHGSEGLDLRHISMEPKRKEIFKGLKQGKDLNQIVL